MNKLKKITLRSVIDEGDIIPQNAMKHILGGYNDWGNGCSCNGQGSYCITSDDKKYVCCGWDMETCYNFVKDYFTHGDSQSCGNCA